MKIARLLCALWVCGPLALDVRAADSPARHDAAVAPAKGHPTAHESTQARPTKGDGPKGRNAAVAALPRRGSTTARHAAGPLARNNADRLRSLHPAKAQGNTALTPNRRIGPKIAAEGAAANAKMSVPGRGMPRVAPGAKAMVRGSMVGGPRVAAGPGQLGGPATGRTAHNTAIDGTQLRHKT